jgi:hypothetical protein
MICSICGGQVEWQGPFANLTHTKCLRCGATNCQLVESSVFSGMGYLFGIDDSEEEEYA